FEYMPERLTMGWGRDPRLWGHNDASFSGLERAYEKQCALVAAMGRAGVRILAGTDLGNPYLYPGFSLHDELDLLLESGLTSLQALQAATLGPAEYFGQTDSLGTVEPGKVADLVLLDANPLLDVANVRRIAAVCVRGAFLSRATLQGLRDEVRAAAR